MAMVAEGEILSNEVGFLGEESPNDSPNDPEKKHRRLSCLGIGIGARVYLAQFKCRNLKVGRCYCQGHVVLTIAPTLYGGHRDHD